MDVYPDIAIDLGMIRKGSLPDRAIGFLGDWARRRADGIIVLGDDMKARLIARGIPEEKLIVAENWADGEEIRPRPIDHDGPLRVLYSGNFGLAHEDATIREVIRVLRNDDRFEFLFVGAGSRHKQLEAFCKSEGIGNVVFAPYVKRAELGESLSRGHLGLVTQIPATCGSVVPSKVYGIMAAGRPLLFIGPEQATPARLIERHSCGWHIQPGNAGGLVQLLQQLAEKRELVSQAGGRAREAFDLFYEREKGVARILRAIGLTEPGDGSPLTASTSLETSPTQSNRP